MWRHKDWKNPYPDDGSTPYIVDITSTRIMMHRAWEGGADAMLEGLLEHGLKVNNLSIENQGKGTVIFIPEEEQ